MESISLEHREVLLDLLGNIQKAIYQLKEWNKEV